MASICHTPIGGPALRVTRLSGYGIPVTGACGTGVSAGWTQVSMTDDVDAPAEWRIRPGAAMTCLAVRTPPLLNWVDATIAFCQVDPEILNIITSATLVADAGGDSAGWAADTTTYATGSFALEVWTRLTGTATCADGVPRYGYLLLPWLVGGIHGPVTHERGTVTFTVKATTQLGNQWGDGPYNVVTDVTGVAVPLLEPIPVTRHRHWQTTLVPPPAAACGCQPLVPV